MNRKPKTLSDKDLTELADWVRIELLKRGIIHSPTCPIETPELARWYLVWRYQRDDHMRTRMKIADDKFYMIVPKDPEGTAYEDWLFTDDGLVDMARAIYPIPIGTNSLTEQTNK